MLTVHELAEAVSEGGHVGRWRLEIEVEAVDYGVAEGLSDGVCAVYGVGLGGEAAFGVGRAADGQEDGLSLALAGLDFLS